MPSEGILVTDKTLDAIVSRFPSLKENYDQEEIAELIADRYYLITNPLPGWPYYLITDDTLLLEYGSVSPDIESKFVPLTPVK